MWSSHTFAEENEADTSVASGGNQIIASPINLLLDLGELGSASVLFIDKDGIPVEGHKIQIIPQDNSKIAVQSGSLLTNKSGYIYFSIIGKQQGDTVVSVTDEAISTHITIAIRNLIRYVLPYFYGDMQLSLINPSEENNYAKIQFNENSDRFIPPVVVELEGKEMKTLKLSEETNITLKDGWAEIFSTDLIFGGVWTNKGYLPFSKVEE